MNSLEKSSGKTPKDLFAEGNFNELGAIYYGIYDHLLDHGHAVVNVVVVPDKRDGSPDWHNASPISVAPPQDDAGPTSIEEARRWAILADQIDGCDPATAILLWFDPESGNPQLAQIAGPEHDRDIAQRIIGRDIGAEPAMKDDEPSELQESMAKLTERLLPPKSEPERLTSFNARDLMGMDFPPVRYVVPGYIAEGCTILAGASKLGKSWLVLQAAMAVARGSTCLGGECEQGDVLFLALEDNPRRLKERLRMQNPTAGILRQEMPACLQFETEWPRADQGGLQKIVDWLTEHPNAKLVIIDVLKMFRANRKGNKNPYDLDYEDINPLSKIAAAFNVAIVVVHHTNKGALSSDPFDRVNGTGGISGAADTTLILARNDDGLVELYGRGRDIEEIETAITFDKATCTWSVRGNAHEVHMSDASAKIMRVLTKATEPMGPTAIAALAGLKPVVVRQHLPRLAKSGEVQKEGRGKWAMAGKVAPSKTDDTNDTNATFKTPANDNADTKVSKVSKVSGGECSDTSDDDIPAFLKKEAA